MTTQNVPLTEHGQGIVDSVVKRGEHKNAAEVVDVALRQMESSRRAYDAKVEALRQDVRAGLDDLDAGRYTVVSPDELPAFVAGLSPRLRQDTVGQ